MHVARQCAQPTEPHYTAREDLIGLTMGSERIEASSALPKTRSLRRRRTMMETPIASTMISSTAPPTAQPTAIATVWLLEAPLSLTADARARPAMTSFAELSVLTQ